MYRAPIVVNHVMLLSNTHHNILGSFMTVYQPIDIVSSSNHQICGTKHPSSLDFLI